MAQASIRRLLWTVLLMLAASSVLSAANAWRDNLTRAEVVAALGPPQSNLRAGARESMTYPGGVTIQLQNGIVTNITGPVPAALRPPGAVTTATPPPAAAPAAPVPAAPAAKPPPAPTPAAATPTPNAPSADQEAEKIIGDFSNSAVVPPGSSLSGVLKKGLTDGKEDGSATPAVVPKGLLADLSKMKPDSDSAWSRPDTWQGFAAGFLLKTLVIAVVLKAVFMFKDFPILLREVVLVAAGVALCNQALAYAFTLNDFGKIAAMVQADQLIAAVVLLVLIMNFTAAKRFPTAAGITVTAMIVNVGVGYALLFFL